MTPEKLAFLQNFYTDVTLYVPAEPPAAAVEPLPVPAATPASPPTSAPAPTPAPMPAKVSAPEVRLPSRSFSNPTAGLERLATGYQHAPADAPAPPPVVAPVPTGVAGAVPPVMLTPFTVLGNDRDGVVLLFRVPPEQLVKLQRNVFLNKMLQALGLVMADVLLVNVESHLPVALVNLRRELAATHVVAFGKNLLDTTVRNTQIYEPVLFPNLNLSYLASATVDLVEYDVSLKKRLWPGLQAMFLG